jgi:hypothetical protein
MKKDLDERMIVELDPCGHTEIFEKKKLDIQRRNDVESRRTKRPKYPE